MDLNPLSVRFASVDDEDTCRRLDKHWPESSVPGKIAAQAYILAEEDGESVGYLRLEYLWGKIPFVGLIWLAPEYRGRGIGQAVLTFLEAHLRERGYRTLLSSSQVDEAAPQAWHRALGLAVGHSLYVASAIGRSQ